MNSDDIKELFISTYRAELLEEKKNRILFKISDVIVELNLDHFNKITSILKDTLITEETEIYNQKYYEILVRDTSVFFSFRDSEHCIEDSVNGLKYSYGKPSDEYMLFFIERFFKEREIQLFRRYFDPSRFARRRSQIKSEQEELFNVSIFDVLKESIRGLETLKIYSGQLTKKIQFEQYSYSYIFSLSYNTSRILYPLRFFAEFFAPFHAGRKRRILLQDMEPPRRLYVNNLILFYQKGLSSDSPDHQFLSFFHILEHFFEEIYNEDLLKNIRNELTRPDFSYKKKKDIESLVKIIQNKLRYKNEEFKINEIEALELTLIKYIENIEDIKIELNSIDKNLTEYFKTNEVPFSKGNKVNFDLENKEEIFKNLAKRIYLTRNSIVHSKETEKEKYIPFRDDKDLIPEIYLMQVLTEKVIIANSKEI